MSKKAVKKAGRGKGNAPETIYVHTCSISPSPDHWTAADIYLSEADFLSKSYPDNAGCVVGVYKLVSAKRVVAVTASLTDA